jgi:hypothetical protein
MTTSKRSKSARAYILSGDGRSSPLKRTRLGSLAAAAFFEECDIGPALTSDGIDAFASLIWESETIFAMLDWVLGGKGGVVVYVSRAPK